MDTLEGISKENAARYEAALTTGRRIVGQRWRAVLPETRSTLVASGYYSPQGVRQDVEYETGVPEHRVEDLEHALGVLGLCNASRLPLVTEKGAPISVEAFTDDVLGAAGELLRVRAWHDPDFLRMALYAVIKHQMANALESHSPQPRSSAAWGCVAALFKLALVVAMPPSLAVGIAAASRQDVGTASLAFYIFGFGVLAALSAHGVAPKSKQPVASPYPQWESLSVDGGAGIAGAAALERLRALAALGVKVPPVAVDLAETLRVRCAAPVSHDAVSKAA